MDQRGTGMLRSIVVGTDFSRCSADALACAMRLARHAGAQVRVIHVIDSDVADRLQESIGVKDPMFRDHLLDDARAAWSRFAAAVPGAEQLPFEVVVANRIVGVLAHGAAHSADLLVMGAFGDRALDIGAGSLATACVRKSPADVLLVREGTSDRFTRIVAAIDFSDTSVRALARAADVARADGSELHVLHCFEAPWAELHYRAPTPMTDRHQQQQYRDTLARRLEAIAAKAAPGLNVRTVCLDRPAHRSMIAQYAADVGADLIVLGTRGRTTVRDILLGSTAERVLAQSACSVLAVKPEGFRHPLSEPRPDGQSPVRMVL